MRQLLQEHRPLTASGTAPSLRAAVVGLGRQATDDHIPGLLMVTLQHRFNPIYTSFLQRHPMAQDIAAELSE